MINTDLEKVIRENTASFGLVGSEFVVRVQHDLGDEGLVFYIRPQDRDGQTVEFIVKGNDLETKEGVYRPTHTSPPDEDKWDCNNKGHFEDGNSGCCIICGAKFIERNFDNDN